MERCCKFVYKFKDITWTKVAITICILPFVFLLLILVIILLCSVDTQGAVVSNTRICAMVGRNILSKGGSAVDAAIGTMLCEGISLPTSAGIGGGFSAIIRMEGNYDSIVATPTLPDAITNVKTDTSFLKGAKAAGVPGELMGYWEMHQKYGMLSWKEIIEPSIKLCIEGVPITEWLAGMLRHNSEKLAASPTMSQIFPESQTNLYKQDFKIKFPALSKTLRKIADHGVSEFYGGEVGKAFVKDVQEAGGLITIEDLKNYKVLWDKKLPTLRLKQKFKVYSTPPPTMGAVIILIMNIIKSQNYKKDIHNFWHYTVEAMRYSFNFSLALGDSVNDSTYGGIMNKVYRDMLNPDIARLIRRKIENNENETMAAIPNIDIEKYFGQGSANICVLAPNGDIVAGTTSIFQTFGAQFCSLKTGIIASNLLSRFIDEKNGSLSELVAANRAIPRKHFLTPHSPSIVVDTLDRPILIVGSSGGPRAITLIANAIIRYVLLGQSAADAVLTHQLHHQLSPFEVEYEESFDTDILDFLIEVGHKVVRIHSSYDKYAATTCIGNRNRNPDPQYNIRVGGSKELIQPKHELGFILVAFVMALCISAVGVMLYEVLHPHKRSSLITL